MDNFFKDLSFQLTRIRLSLAGAVDHSLFIIGTWWQSSHASENGSTLEEKVCEQFNTSIGGQAARAIKNRSKII